MTLDEFLADERLELPIFAAWWRAKHAEDPEIFPIEMNPGDWGEQLLCFNIADAEQDGIEARPLSLFTDEELHNELARRAAEQNTPAIHVNKEKTA